MKQFKQLREKKFIVKIKHQHDDGEKIHSYEVTAPNQNKADHQAISMHLQKHPGTMGKFHMWDNQQVESTQADGATIAEGATEKAHAAAIEASELAKKNPSAKTHRAASDAHETAIAAHEKKINSLMKSGGASDEVKTHEDHIKMHKNAAQKHRFAAHRLNAQRNEEVQNEEGLKDACWKGYEAIGMKMKNGRKVPNCVPKEDTTTIEKPVAEDHAEDARTAHQAAHAALKKGDIETYHKEMDKKHAAHVAASAEAAKKPVKTFESTDDEKNLKITKHEKAAVEASRRGDKQAQQYHLNIVKNLQNESVNEATEPKMQKHLVTVTVTDPHHAMTTKRKEKIMKRVKVSAADPKDAVKRAEAHYKKHGFKVHDSLHHSIVKESLDTDEFIDSYDPTKNEASDENARDAVSMAKGQINQITQMAAELADLLDGKEDLEPWVSGKFTVAVDQLDDAHSYLKYGEKEYDQADDDKDTEENVSENTEGQKEDEESIQKIKLLIRLGMLEMADLPIAVRVLHRIETDQPVTAVQERQVLSKLMKKFVEFVTQDDFIFRKVRQTVVQTNKNA